MSRWLAGWDDGATVVWLRRAVFTLLVAGFLAFVARGADRPADPVLRPAPVGSPSSTLPGG